MIKHWQEKNPNPYPYIFTLPSQPRHQAAAPRSFSPVLSFLKVTPTLFSSASYLWDWKLVYGLAQCEKLLLLLLPCVFDLFVFLRWRGNRGWGCQVLFLFWIFSFMEMGMQNYCDLALVYGFCVVIDLFVSWESVRLESI